MWCWMCFVSENCCMCLKRLLRREVKGNDAATRQELENAEMKVEQCKVNNCFDNRVGEIFNFQSDMAKNWYRKIGTG